MRDTLIIYLAVAALLSLVNSVVISHNQPKSSHNYYPHTFFSICIANFGYLYLALSTSLSEAILASKIAFVAGAFLPTFLLFAMLHQCRIKIKPSLYAGLMSLSLITYMLYATCGYNDLFKSNIQYVTHFGVAYTTSTSEFGSFFFCAELIVYSIAYICIVMYSFFHRKSVSFRSMLSLTLIGAISLVSYIASYPLGMNEIIMPGILLIDEYILILMMNRMGKYNMESTIYTSLLQTNTNAYVTFTKGKRFIGCNDIALNYFPEMKDFRIDQVLDDKNSTAKTLLNLLNQFAPDDLSKIFYFQHGNLHYKCLIKRLFLGNKDSGYIMRIEDDTKMQRYIKFLDKYNNELVNNVQDKDSHIHAMQEQMIVGMANMVENRDSNTGGHIKRTSQVIRILISEMRKDESMGLTNKFCRAVVKAAPMHDLGKIAVDDIILRKPGKFTLEEYDIMKTHAEKGAAIVENLLRDIEDPELVTIAKNIANYHHELWNGTGYPKRLKGTEIPLEARIMAIADVYDALVSQRCYKEKISCSDAYDIIINSMGSHFDPGLKPYFIKCREELESYYNNALAN